MSEMQHSKNDIAKVTDPQVANNDILVSHDHERPIVTTVVSLRVRFLVHFAEKPQTADKPFVRSDVHVFQHPGRKRGLDSLCEWTCCSSVRCRLKLQWHSLMKQDWVLFELLESERFCTTVRVLD